MGTENLDGLVAMQTRMRLTAQLVSTLKDCSPADSIAAQTLALVGSYRREGISRDTAVKSISSLWEDLDKIVAP